MVAGGAGSWGEAGSRLQVVFDGVDSNVDAYEPPRFERFYLGAVFLVRLLLRVARTIARRPAYHSGFCQPADSARRR